MFSRKSWFWLQEIMILQLALCCKVLFFLPVSPPKERHTPSAAIIQTLNSHRHFIATQPKVSKYNYLQKKIGVYIRGVKSKNRNDCIEQWNLPHCKGSCYQIVKVQLSHTLIDSHNFDTFFLRVPLVCFYWPSLLNYAATDTPSTPFGVRHCLVQPVPTFLLCF